MLLVFALVLRLEKSQSVQTKRSTDYDSTMMMLTLSENESIQPEGADDAIYEAAKGKIGAENLCKNKKCVEPRQCCTLSLWCCVYVSIRNQHSLPPNKTDLAGKCIKSTGECSISTYDEKQGSACDDNRRTMNDVCKNGECVGVSVNTGKRNLLSMVLQEMSSTLDV